MKVTGKILGLVGLILIILVAAAFLVFSEKKTGKTQLYFNAESDLPDPFIYIKEQDFTNPPAHILEISKKYNIIFTVESRELKPKNYSITVNSDLVNKSESFSLKPRESKKFVLTVSPTIESKWTFNSTVKSSKENFVDITKNSWLAERRDFTVIVRESGLPAIVEEKYDLPISSDIESFGRVYHMNVSLNELRSEPFERSYTIEESKDSGKVVTNDSIRLSVENNQLHVIHTSRSDYYISESKPFRVALTEGGSSTIDEKVGLEKLQEINFMYKIG